MWRLERDLEAARRIGADHDFSFFEGDAARAVIGSPIVRGLLQGGPRRAAQPPQAGPRPRPRGRATWACGSTSAHRRPRSRAGRVDDRLGAVGGAADRRRDERLPARLPAVRAQGPPAVELRDGDRAAERRAARAGSPGRAARASRTSATSSRSAASTADGRDPLGRPPGAVLPRQRHGPAPHGQRARVRRAARGVARALPDVAGRAASPTPTAAASRSPARSSPTSASLGDGIYYGYGYNGHGVAPSHTVGRALCDLVLERESEHTALVFVNQEGAERFRPSRCASSARG